MSIRLIALVSLFLVAGCRPLALLPGGKLDGVPAQVPSDWASTDEVSTVQLETLPKDPYSVNIWAVGMGSALYIHAGANHTQWVENMEADPDVRVRVDKTLYDLRAARVEDQGEFTRFSNAHEKKYGVRPGNQNVKEAYLFRLVAR